MTAIFALFNCTGPVKSLAWSGLFARLQESSDQVEGKLADDHGGDGPSEQNHFQLSKLQVGYELRRLLDQVWAP